MLKCFKSDEVNDDVKIVIRHVYYYLSTMSFLPENITYNETYLIIINFKPPLSLLMIRYSTSGTIQFGTVLFDKINLGRLIIERQKEQSNVHSPNNFRSAKQQYFNYHNHYLKY